MYKNLVNQVKQKNLDVHGIEIFQNGKITFKQWFSPDVRYPVYSATKSFVSTAVGIACDEGKISVDVPLYEFLDRKYLCCVPASQLDAFKKLTLERFMTMSVAGYPFRPSGSDWTEYSLSLLIDYSRPPVFSYSNKPVTYTNLTQPTN
ncbi:MAG: beta-lactamase family protein [Ruminococcus sp.]|nr:beta-lactamase family protein [Ruminococcus sp.]